MLNHYLSEKIDELCKLIKKYEYDKLIRFYILSRFMSKYIDLYNKWYNNVVSLFYS